MLAVYLKYIYVVIDNDKVLKFHISNSSYFEKSGLIISVASESFKNK